MKLYEMGDVVNFPGIPSRTKDEITGHWIDDINKEEYIVVGQQDGREVGIATYNDERKAQIRAKKEKLKGIKGVKVILV